jgi:iron complex outermembrane receptor protein
LLLLATPHNVIAAEQAPQDLILAAGRSGMTLEWLAQSVQVIDADTIAALGAQSIGDVLRVAPDASAGYSRVGAFQSESLRVRGLHAGQVRNGIRQHYLEEADASALSNIERIEVLKGPSGVLYGPSGLGGVLSIVTRQPDGQFGAQLSATLGSQAQKLITADFRVPVSEQMSMRVTGQIERSGTFVDHDNIDRENLAFALQRALSDRVIAHLVTEYVERRTQYYPGLPLEGTVLPGNATPLPRSLYLGEPSQDELSVHAPLVQAWADVKLNDRWTLTPRLQYEGFNADFTQIRLQGAQADRTTINRDGRSGSRDDAGSTAQIDLSGSLVTGLLTHRLLAGYEFVRERGQLMQYELTGVPPISVLNPVYAFVLNGPNRTLAFDRHRKLDSSALYLQDQITLTPRWRVTGSVRHSWLEDSVRDAGAAGRGTEVQSTPWQLGSTFALRNGLALYGGYGRGFDAEFSGGLRAADGSPLQPERSAQLEGGIRLSQGALRGSLSAFQLRRSESLSSDPRNPGFSLNAGAQRVRGVALQGDWQAAPLWTLSGGYALLQAKITRSNDGDQGSRPADVPRHSAALRTAYEIPRHALTLRAALSHVSDRLPASGSSIRLHGYTLLDTGVSWKIRTVEVDVALTNLADKRYFTASGSTSAVVPGDPRRVQVRLGTHW